MFLRSSVSRTAALGAGALLTIACAGIASAGTPVQDPIPVGPNAFFTAAVNGQANTAVIRTDCAGPVGSAQTGHPVSGQSVEAFRVNAGTSTKAGYTGAGANSLLVTLGGPSTGTTGPIGTLTSFFAPLAIPTTVTVPCSGTGTVVFTPKPANTTAVPYTVDVTFVSVNPSA